MTSLDAIGTSQQAGGFRTEAAPSARVRQPDSEKPIDKAERPERRPPAQRVELPARAFQARLNYDADAEEVVVEILDPNTGDVLTRIPAEDLPDDIRAQVASAGPLVETFA